jgi:hypothetical protein
MEQRSHIFISYSHEDAPWLKRLLIMLKPATRDGSITVWTDTQIKPGEKWRDEIHTALRQANIAVLLVSPNYLASDFIAAEEFPAFLSAAERDGLNIFWVPISDCLFEMTKIAAYQATSDPSKPLDAISAVDANRELANTARKIVAKAKEPRLDKATLEEKLIKASEELRSKEAVGRVTVSRISVDALAAYGSRREEVREIGRISPLAAC